MTATLPLKLTLVVPEIKVANVHFNFQQILKALPRFDPAYHQMVVFPELALTGKTCGDLFHQPTLLESALEAVDELTRVCAKRNLWVLVGFPFALDYRIYNAAAFMSPEGLQAFVIEKHPKARQFSPLETLTTNSIGFYEDQVPIGADLSFNLPQLTDRTLQIVVGDLEQASLSESAQLLINPHTHPAIAERDDLPDWPELIGNGKPDFVMATCSGGPTESSTDWVACGAAQIIADHTVLAETRKLQFTTQTCQFVIQPNTRFSWKIRDFPIPTMRLRQTPFIREDDPEAQYREVLEIQAAGLMGRLRHTGLKKVIFGNSGGADSSMALLVCVRAFQRLRYPLEDILAVSMPGPGSTADSQARSTALAEAAGVTIKTIPIGAAVAQHLKDIGHPQGLHDTTFENAQARERTQILMDLANQQNALMVGTGDLSEIALGWATFNGDHMSMYNVNAGVPKTLLMEVLAWAGKTLLGKEGARITKTIANAIISPELVPSDSDHPAQSTEAILGPYLLHDFFLWHGIAQQNTPDTVFKLASIAFKADFTPAEILKALKTFYRRFFGNQFKRNASADGPQVLPISLSPRGGFEMPSDANPGMWLEELEYLGD